MVFVSLFGVIVDEENEKDGGDKTPDPLEGGLTLGAQMGTESRAAVGLCNSAGSPVCFGGDAAPAAAAATQTSH